MQDFQIFKYVEGKIFRFQISQVLENSVFQKYEFNMNLIQEIAVRLKEKNWNFESF